MSSRQMAKRQNTQSFIAEEFKEAPTQCWGLFIVSIRQTHPLPLPAHPLNIERIAHAERVAINEEEKTRTLAVREIMRRLNHRFNALARRRNGEYPHGLKAELRGVHLAFPDIEIQRDLAGEARAILPVPHNGHRAAINFQHEI